MLQKETICERSRTGPHNRKAPTKGAAQDRMTEKEMNIVLSEKFFAYNILLYIIVQWKVQWLNSF